jgi:PST family polysaccharide transporter
LIQAAGALWSASFLNIALSLIRGKVSAVWLGPDGVGLIAQLNYLSTFFSGLALLGVTNGTIKLMAEARARGDDVRSRELHAIALFFPLIVGGIVALGFAVSAPWTAAALLGDQHVVALLAAAASIPFGMLVASYSMTLQGEGRIRALAVANGAGVVIGSALVLVLIVTERTDGAIVGVVLTSIIAAAVFVVRERRAFAGTRAVARAAFRRSSLRPIYAFGAASILITVLSSTSDLALRTLIIHRLGIRANGLYQPVTAFSGQFFLAAITGISTYLFPRLTSLYAGKEHGEAERELTRALRLILVVVVPAACAAIVLAPLVLRLAFSSAFLPAESALRWQVAGEFFRAITWTVGAALLPLGRVRMWAALSAVTLLVQVGVTVLLIDHVGLAGAGQGFAVAWLVAAVLTCACVRHLGVLRLSRSFVLSTATGALLIGLSLMAVAWAPRAGVAVLGLSALWGAMVWPDAARRLMQMRSRA